MVSPSLVVFKSEDGVGTGGLWIWTFLGCCKSTVTLHGYSTSVRDGGIESSYHRSSLICDYCFIQRSVHWHAVIKTKAGPLQVVLASRSCQTHQEFSWGCKIREWFQSRPVGFPPALSERWNHTELFLSAADEHASDLNYWRWYAEHMAALPAGPRGFPGHSEICNLFSGFWVSSQVDGSKPTTGRSCSDWTDVFHEHLRSLKHANRTRSWDTLKTSWKITTVFSFLL